MPSYDVAISFAGDDRRVAALLAKGLVLKGLNVFYDEYAQADLWGKDLYAHLTSVYKDEAKYCLMIISVNYIQKQWTSLERRAAQARAFSESSEYILPLRLDDTPVDGVLPTTGYIDYRTVPTERVVELIVEKVRAYNLRLGISYEIVTAEEVFKNEDVGPKNAPALRDSDMRTTCPTCHQEQMLAEAPISLDFSDTLYTCKNGCQTLVVISRPGMVPWPGRGFRVGSYVIRNATDLFIKTENMGRPVLVPASTAALMKVRPNGEMHDDS